MQKDKGKRGVQQRKQVKRTMFVEVIALYRSRHSCNVTEKPHEEDAAIQYCIEDATYRILYYCTVKKATKYTKKPP